MIARTTTGGTLVVPMGNNVSNRVGNYVSARPLDFRPLRGCECPRTLDLTDFGIGGLGWANRHKTSGDDGVS
jgi:hypothetical protein